ncbi:YHYH protein [Hydrogenophaga sp. PAMC20947]|uniref:YHYH protein n=1 Tax=Hydrogenophaga sp. PAMC20947 TaxID=2565558 RepID=UPI00109DDF14|nr:YHYH protein [Hydrogenophaga sp. PAMC20947]QCB46173.1 YHYH protein [Hydrogenophaga sp. PAMC20947]
MKTPISRPFLLALFAAAAVSLGGFTPLNAMATGASPFTVTSEAGPDGTLPDTYTCDGAGVAPALAWSNPPEGTQEFALLMSTVPPDGVIKYNWVLYGIPGTTTQLSQDSHGVGTLGAGSNGPSAAYQPPCSKGPGQKSYTFTVYALSAAPVLPQGTPVSGPQLLSAMSSITLGTTNLSLHHTRSGANANGNAPPPPPPPAAATAAMAPASSVATTGTQSEACARVANSLKASTTGVATVECDGIYAYVASNGLPTHTMMDGIVASNLQVPIAQSFFGANAWKIPLQPAIAATTTTANDGPIGVAINGVPIFNPCKQGGCQNGDTKALGELDACNGHAGRADDYHYHAAPNCLMVGQPAGYWDTHPLGWALDGFAIFGYNDADGRVASRDDVCGGNTSAVANAPSGYSYHVTDAAPYVLSCFRGTPSPDLAGQGAKFSPLRRPPVRPFGVSAMTLTTDARDGYQVLQFQTDRPFTSTETGTDSYEQPAGTHRIRYKPVTGAALAELLATGEHAGKSACWSFQFSDGAGGTTQPAVAYCR